METMIPVRSGRLTARVEQLHADIRDQGWAALLVLDPYDITWLTGLKTTNAALIVQPGAMSLVTDFRYVEEARSLGLDVRKVDQSLFGELGTVLADVVGSGTVAYPPAALTHQAFLQLTEHLPDNVTLRAAGGVVGRLRRVKDSSEIDAIARAAKMLDVAWERVASIGLVGKRERDIVREIERALFDAGAEGLSFPAIVASGANGALPHHTPGDALIPAETLVTIDIGCIVDGYCSDCTRTFATGELPAELAEIYDVTLRAQQAALAAIRPGVTGVDVDAVARQIIDDAGYGEQFGHGTGHGVGMEVHEGPRLARTSTDTLEAGMIVTVEPGIYLPGVGGVRIEDLVVVTDGGCDVLTQWSKDLQQA